MRYLRIKSKEEDVGFFNMNEFYDFTGNLEYENYKKFLKMSDELDSTPYISKMKDTSARHYFKQSFLLKHYEILCTIVEKMEGLEVVKAYDEDIKKVWFEDENQIIIQLEEGLR